MSSTTTTTPLNGLFSRITWVSQYQKGKTSQDLNEARDYRVLGCSGIRWTFAFSALTLFVWRQEGHPTCKKKLEWWGTGTVICLEWDADLHMAQLMPLPLTVSCFSKIQIGFTFLVPAHPGSPGKKGRWTCVCVCVASAGPSASRSRQITTPTPHRSIFTGRMFFLTPNQQCQSTDGMQCQVPVTAYL